MLYSLFPVLLNARAGGSVEDVPVHVLALLRVPQPADAVRDVRYAEGQGALHHQQDDAQPGSFLVVLVLVAGVVLLLSFRPPYIRRTI